MIPPEQLEQEAEEWQKRKPERDRHPPRPRDGGGRQRIQELAAQKTAEVIRREAQVNLRRPVLDPEVLRATFDEERVIGPRDLLDTTFMELGVAIARSVGLIKVKNERGTGFLIGPTLLMTARHVLPTRAAATDGILDMDFQMPGTGQLLPVQSFELDPVRLFHASKVHDFTVVAVKPVSKQGKALATYPWMALRADADDAVDKDDALNIIQHPLGGIKQIAVRGNRVIDILDDAIFYETDTQPGSSGAPCFNDLWDVIAVHSRGVPATDAAGKIQRKDKKPFKKGDPDDAVEWVANRGVRMRVVIPELQSLGHELIDEVLRTSPPNPIERALAPAPEVGDWGRWRASTPAPEAAGAVHTWTIPLQITIGFGAPTIAGGTPRLEPRFEMPTPPVPSPGPSIDEKVEIDPDWAGRGGYDPEFLGTTLRPPKMSVALRKAAVIVPAEHRHGLDEHALAYHHFSVVMHRKRRTAIYSICHIHGKKRPKLPKRKDDKWFLDPRIDRALQIGEEAYGNNALDRGHVTRREDPAWGETVEDAIKANNDTFHFTNCAPQHWDFNQNKSTWQGVENFLLDKAKKQKQSLVVATGPIFAPTDPFYRNEKMTKAIQIPIRFWKVAALLRPDDMLVTTAFILDQAELIGDATDLEDEKFEAETHQCTIAEVEELTGLGFGDFTPHDHLAGGGELGVFERGGFRRKKIEGAGDLSL